MDVAVGNLLHDREKTFVPNYSAVKLKNIATLEAQTIYCRFWKMGDYSLC